MNLSTRNLIEYDISDNELNALSAQQKLINLIIQMDEMPKSIETDINTYHYIAPLEKYLPIKVNKHLVYADTVIKQIESDYFQ